MKGSLTEGGEDVWLSYGLIQLRCPASAERSGGELLGDSGHLGGAVELVPVEGFAVDCALDGAEEHPREELAVGETLNPDVDQQPGVAFAGGVFAFQQEGERGGGEVDEQEGEEEGQELVEVGGAGGFGMEVFVDEVVNRRRRRT